MDACIHCISFHFFLLFYLSILLFRTLNSQNFLPGIFYLSFFFDRKNRKTLAKTLITKFIYIISVSFNFILEQVRFIGCVLFLRGKIFAMKNYTIRRFKIIDFFFRIGVNWFFCSVDTNVLDNENSILTKFIA